MLSTKNTHKLRRRLATLFKSKGPIEHKKLKNAYNYKINALLVKHLKHLQKKKTRKENKNYCVCHRHFYFEIEKNF